MIRSEEDEQQDPVPAGTACRAEYTYNGEYPHDLSFEEGDTLTLIGPCNKIFWYLAEDYHGNRGVVPINHLLRVDSPANVTPPSMDRAPLAPPSMDRAPLAPPSMDRAPLAPPSKDRAPPAPPSKDRAPPAPPSMDRAPLAPPSMDRAPLAPPTKDRPPLAPPSMDRAPLAPPTKDRPPLAPPSMDRAPVVQPIDTSTRSNHSEGEYSWGERPPLDPPVQQTKKTGNPLTHPPPNCKYRDVLAFRANSGWCTPSVDEVLMRKAQFSNMMLFQKLRVGVYVFMHKSIPNLKYVGKSYELYYELCRLFENIYSKPISHLSPIEEQLRFHHPDASQWHVRIYSCRMDELDLLFAKRIVLMQSLAPNGLNRELVFAGREEWEQFCEWFMKERPSR